ncbi:hypothetical protein Rhopal_004504-T1 [Rhodotorula paludigena]|uniref:AAA+ ATPase domain-containing protein n=1 Tax=Rhodotorula paludigena TaxID=86838 RepID=A0AAV5GPL7_9BASI|nr:hypothetical protein Rhopal_004504-T1 [Rhodotorula paludigena]
MPASGLPHLAHLPPLPPAPTPAPALAFAPSLGALPALPPLPAQPAEPGPDAHRAQRTAPQGQREMSAGARPRRANRAASYADAAAEDDSDAEYSPQPVQHASSSRPTRRAAAARKSYAVEDDDDDFVDDAGAAHHHGDDPDASFEHEGATPAYVAAPVHEEPQQQQQQPIPKIRFKLGSAPEAAEPAADDDQDAAGEADLDAAGEDDPEGAPAGVYGGEQQPQYGGEAAYAEGAAHDEDEEQVGGHGLRPRRRAAVVRDSEDEEDDFYQHEARRVLTTTSSGRQTRRPQFYGESAEEEDVKPVGTRRSLRRGRSGGGYHGEGIDADEDYEVEDGDYGSRSTRGRERSRRVIDQQRQLRRTRDRNSLTQPSKSKARTTRNSRKADQSYEDGESTEVDTDEDMLDLGDDDDDDSLARENQSSGRRLRNKPRVNYYVPLALESNGAGSSKDAKGKGKQRRTDEDGNPFAGLPANMTGAQWAALYPEGGQPSDSSDDDVPNMNSPRKAALFTGPGAAGMTGGMLSGGGLDFGSGAPSNLGKVNNAAALADTDPLGVPTSISFDSVGGLGSHIQQLKEMVSLPLLYPEVFERFAITPPRGVLFHGPPGTGKTLLARALAASCSTEGRKISFFMRKGADCLSKWVGEAERQLRLLFDEARACQPSIIFFDEIDGLAPVRSSKQEQIHASIVSTLLALMDGMDGRGQVIVIGATNRPDAIDPALRRPGRFDREFYFPLPNAEARRKILDIHTGGWNPPLEDEFKDELAKLTKGYGGADLRALCTEAALNAVQRTYPQIYKTNDRLLIKPESISVTARDFAVSQKTLIPSTARSTSSSAAPLPAQLAPLLSNSLDHAKAALSKVLPETKRVNVLEEAEYVDEGGGFEKEKMLQAFETLRVFRPRMIICGEPSMGQSYVAAAVLQHLEGFHVQTLDLATLVSDSTRTMEAACVQLFVEAKRHKPSILFIPSLETWCTSVGETVRATIKGLLDGLDPSDPILLLAVVDGHFSEIPPDVRSWFGFVKGNRVIMGKPDQDQRKHFFAELIAAIHRPPSEYPGAMPRRKRKLEKLPIAPPPPPRAPTAAEIAQQEQNDLRLLEYLKFRFGPVLAELKKRYKRFQRSLYRDWQNDDLEWRREQLKRGETVTGLGTQPYHNVDLDTMASDLYKGFYYTPDDFLVDIQRIQANAEVNKIMENDAEAPIRAGQMVNHVKVMLDQTFDAAFRAECEKVAERMREKDKADPRRRSRRKGREGELPGEEGALAAAEAAAEAGGAHRPRYGARAHEEEDGEEGVDAAGEAIDGGDAVQAERNLKRARDGLGENEKDAQGAGDMEGVEVDGEHGAAKRQRLGAEGPEPFGSNSAATATELPNGQAVASTSGVNGSTGHVAAGASSAFADILNPTASSSLAGFASHFSPAPPASTNSAPLPSADHPAVNGFPAPVPPPMPVGGTPADAIAQPGPANGTAPSFLSGLIAPPQPADNPFANAAQPADALAAAKKALSAASTLAPDSRDATPTPVVNGSAPASQDVTMAGAGESTAQAQVDEEEERSPTPEPTPPPPPPFVVPAAAVSALEAFLVDKTGSLNVDQLEQLRAACFDTIWRAKSDWDRSHAVQELDELAREFIEEVEALAA